MSTSDRSCSPSRKENIENELIVKEIKNMGADKKREQMLAKLASRNAKLKEKSVLRRVESKKVDFDAIEQSFVEQTEQKEGFFAPQSFQSRADNDMFRVPSLPQPDISAISYDQMNTSFNSTVNDNAPISSTPLVSRLRAQVSQLEEGALFKTPPSPSCCSVSDNPNRTNVRLENKKKDLCEIPTETSSVPDFYLSVDEKMQKQLDALAAWGNCVLKAGIERDEVDFGKTKEDARRALSRLLQKTESEGIKTTEGRVHTYRDWVQKRRMDEYRQRCFSLFAALEYRVAVTKSVSMGQIAVRKNLKVYADISLQTSLLRILFSFHPLWLHLALETVFTTVIDVRIEDNFPLKMARFIQERLFVNKNLLKLKKMSKNGKTSLVTPEGERALHNHFLQHFTLMLIAIEEFKRNHLIEHAPRMFTKASGYKCLNDLFSDVSREVLSASAKPFPKALAGVGFVPSYKQTFIEETNYRITSISDLHDGVVLGKLVEIVTDSPCDSIMTQLRNPGGDRIRKIGNVQVVLDSLKKQDIDIGLITAQSIVASHRDSVLELLWRLVGFYTERCGSPILPLGYLSYSPREQNKSSGHSSRVFTMCKSVGERIGVQVSDYTSLRDGRVLAELWSMYAGPAHPLTAFPGEGLFDRVYNAADVVLGVPRCVFDDDRSMNLFVHIYVGRLADMHQMQRSATVIQRWWRTIKQKEMIRNMSVQEVSKDVQKTLMRDNENVALLSAKERSFKEQQDIKEFEELERSIISPVSDMGCRTYLVIDDREITPSGQSSEKSREEETVVEKTTLEEITHLPTSQKSLQADERNDVEDVEVEANVEELELSVHEQQLIDAYCIDIVEEELCSDRGEENCAVVSNYLTSENDAGGNDAEDVEPVKEVEDMFDMLCLQEKFENEENTQHPHEESKSEVEREVEDTNELFTALKEEQDHLAYENQEEVHEIEHIIESSLPSALCQEGNLTIPKDEGDDENHGAYETFDEELVELEKSLSHGHAIGEGLVLERSMIGGEMSFGWTEEHDEEIDEEERKEENTVENEKINDVVCGIDHNVNNTQIDSQVSPSTKSLSDPFTGFEKMTDLSEIKHKKFLESLPVVCEKVVDEHILSKEEWVVLSRQASEGAIEIATESVDGQAAEASNDRPEDAFTNETCDSFGGNVERKEKIVRDQVVSPRSVIIDPYVEIYHRINALQKEHDVLKRICAKAEKKLKK